MTTRAGGGTAAGIRQALERVEIFRGLSGDGLSRLAGEFRAMQLEAGRTLFEQGDEGDGVYLLLAGTLTGHSVSENGRDLVYASIPPGTLFGELAMLDDLPRSLTLTAASDSQLLHLSAPAFRALLLAEPRVTLNLAAELSRRNRRLNDQVFGLVMHDVRTRVRLLLVRLAREAGQFHEGGVLEPCPTHEAIAGQIGANREAVSRAISDLNRQGVIEAGRKRILFRDIEALDRVG